MFEDGFYFFRFCVGVDVEVLGFQCVEGEDVVVRCIASRWTGAAVAEFAVVVAGLDGGGWGDAGGGVASIQWE